MKERPEDKEEGLAGTEIEAFEDQKVVSELRNLNPLSILSLSSTHCDSPKYTAVLLCLVFSFKQTVYTVGLFQRYSIYYKYIVVEFADMIILTTNLRII